MRIAFLTHEPIHPPSGGGSAEAVYLLREMIARGHSLTVFCPEIADRPEVEERLGVKIVPFKRWRMGRYAKLRNIKYLFYPLALERLVLSNGAKSFDLIFAQHSISAVAAGRLRKRLGIPVVMNFLDFLTAFTETWPRLLAPRSLVRTITDFEIGLPSRYQADAVLTVSDPLAARFADAGFPLRRIRPIYYGFDSEIFGPGDEARAPSPVVVMHGSFDHHHLGPIIHDAICYVATKVKAVTFRFVGPHTPALDSLLTRVDDLAPNVEIENTGFIDYGRIAHHLADASVGIVPYEESRGTHCAFVAKAVEYLAMGMPVVSTRLDGLASYFRDEPMISFTDFDGIAFGEAIVQILDNEETNPHETRLRIANRVRDDLSWNAVATRAMDFIEATLKNTKE